MFENLVVSFLVLGSCTVEHKIGRTKLTKKKEGSESVSRKWGKEGRGLEKNEEKKKRRSEGFRSFAKKVLWS